MLTSVFSPPNIGHNRQKFTLGLGKVQQIQNCCGVLHLRNGLGRDKTAKINGIKTTTQKGLNVPCLFRCGNKGLYALHGIPWTFYEFYL